MTKPKVLISDKMDPNAARIFEERGCDVTVVPAQTPAAEVLAMAPHGVFMSNGPGDPEPCDYAIAAIREFVAKKVPLFGICLGHQLLALAAGARTVKMAHGHHGANHPVIDLDSGRVRQLTRGEAGGYDPSWSPDGSQIAFEWVTEGPCNSPSCSQISLIDADGSN